VLRFPTSKPKLAVPIVEAKPLVTRSKEQSNHPEGATGKEVLFTYGDTLVPNSFGKTDVPRATRSASTTAQQASQS
jgi:hypothetical protein